MHWYLVVRLTLKKFCFLSGLFFKWHKSNLYPRWLFNCTKESRNQMRVPQMNRKKKSNLVGKRNQVKWVLTKQKLSVFVHSKLGLEGCHLSRPDFSVPKLHVGACSTLRDLKLRGPEVSNVLAPGNASLRLNPNAAASHLSSFSAQWFWREAGRHSLHSPSHTRTRTSRLNSPWVSSLPR